MTITESQNEINRRIENVKARRGRAPRSGEGLYSILVKGRSRARKWVQKPDLATMSVRGVGDKRQGEDEGGSNDAHNQPHTGHREMDVEAASWWER